MIGLGIAIVVWVVVAIVLRRARHRMTLCKESSTEGRILLHTASLFWAPIHAVGIVWANLKGICRELRR